jgi:hypothetical protein
VAPRFGGGKYDGEGDVSVTCFMEALRVVYPSVSSLIFGPNCEDYELPPNLAADTGREPRSKVFLFHPHVAQIRTSMRAYLLYIGIRLL